MFCRACLILPESLSNRLRRIDRDMDKEVIERLTGIKKILLLDLAFTRIGFITSAPF